MKSSYSLKGLGFGTTYLLMMATGIKKYGFGIHFSPRDFLVLLKDAGSLLVAVKGYLGEAI